MSLCWGGVYEGVFLTHSCPFQCEYFPLCLMYRSHSSSFWASFRGNFSVSSCTFSVSTGGAPLSPSWTGTPVILFIDKAKEIRKIHLQEMKSILAPVLIQCSTLTCTQLIYYVIKEPLLFLFFFPFSFFFTFL